jgi:RNA polymerase sigma factor (sigma-70 family)
MTSQTRAVRRYRGVDAHSDAVAAEAAPDDALDFDAMFTAHFARVARVVGRVVRDRGRAEDLAVDAFVKWWRHRNMKGERTVGWLYRVAVRLALDELRRTTRRSRFERVIGALRGAPPTPEDLHSARDEQQRVRLVLSTLRRRDASLLVLRSDGLAYDEVASALGLNPASIGTLISRAQRAFRTEYVRRYGSE